MSTKEWIYKQDIPDIGCYQKMTFNDGNNNPAVIQVNLEFGSLENPHK